MIEERKWRKPSNGMAGVPVWSHNGIVCTGETYKNYVKMTFAKGAFVKDPSGLFNSSLEGNLRRAIDFREDDTINEKALKALIKAAVKLNDSEHHPRKLSGRRRERAGASEPGERPAFAPEALRRVRRSFSGGGSGARGPRERASRGAPGGETPRTSR